MKLKVFTLGLVAVFSLAACQAEQEEGQDNAGNYDGVENTRFERTTDQDNTEAPQNREENDRGMQHNTNYEVAERAAERITKDVKGVEDAYVLKTRDNAYVAAEVDGKDGETDEVSDEVEKQITDIVKDTDQDIDNVYISTNPDFVDLTNNYVNDVDNGEPVEGFFREFGEMVDRIFPDQEG
ncbi:YhcN/YlaJ family sporulation lipoprotein [Halobacillus sp. A5]|uniref:YhcN/YlaJ family sporulation lipoprotein n=1 Tax=Halobacillus sp. A5 TaxID=2880263 RepID=UPI0020A621A6|nr:YhcN/YlaJ family sporulation lipoprotein [Halobacillus sp. A5]MCP3026810.1 YhcN/YlaJ family sporulation lipoprotein [Halobacillus sp. A5]